MNHPVSLRPEHSSIHARCRSRHITVRVSDCAVTDAFPLALDAEIGCVLSEIMEKLKGSVSRENAGWFSRDKLPFGATKVSAKEE